MANRVLPCWLNGSLDWVSRYRKGGGGASPLPRGSCSDGWGLSESLLGLLQAAIFLTQHGHRVLEEHWVQTEARRYQGHAAEPCRHLVDAVLGCGLRLLPEPRTPRLLRGAGRNALEGFSVLGTPPYPRLVQQKGLELERESLPQLGPSQCRPRP